MSIHLQDWLLTPTNTDFLDHYHFHHFNIKVIICTFVNLIGIGHNYFWTNFYVMCNQSTDQVSPLNHKPTLTSTAFLHTGKRITKPSLTLPPHFLLMERSLLKHYPTWLRNTCGDQIKLHICSTKKQINNSNDKKSQRWKCWTVTRRSRQCTFILQIRQQLLHCKLSCLCPGCFFITAHSSLIFHTINHSTKGKVETGYSSWEKKVL